MWYVFPTYFCSLLAYHRHANTSQIVDKSSARLGVPGQRERIIGRDADHTSICKFAVKDEDYEQVEDNIVALVSRARVNRGSPKTPPTPFNSAYPGYFPPRHLSSSTVSLDGSASVQGFENNTSTCKYL